MTRERFVQIIEDKLNACDNVNNAPFGLNHDESAAYLRGKATALQWILEMLPAVFETAK